MNDYTWEVDFRKLYDQAVAQYEAGGRQPAKYFTSAERRVLDGIGCTAQELYDFAEDWCQGGEPSYGTALLITSARRDYFLVIQKGKRSSRRIRMEDLPAKDAVVAGQPWLPRAIAKARAKLRGEMPDELMYDCGGDRAFFQRVGIHPADFLRVVWAAGDDDRRIIRHVTERAAAAGDSN